jgi:hypothetical protein
MTVSALNQAAIKFRKELLMLPIIALESTLQHMTLRPGIQYQEIVNDLTADLELRPHDGSLNKQTGITAGERTLTTYVGDLVTEQKLEDIRQKLLGGQLLLAGKTKQTNKHPLEKQMIALIIKEVSKKLNLAIFNAVRNASGTTTATLFNGFDTLTATEIGLTTIAAGEGNFVDVDPITSSNAWDSLRAFYQAADQNLQSVPTKLFVPYAVYNAYNEDYLATFGAVPYNKEYKKTFLEGSGGLCEIVPLVGKASSNYIHLTEKSNMLVGVDQLSDKEFVKVREVDNPFVTQFVMKMVFGVQFESLAKERLCVGDISAGS